MSNSAIHSIGFSMRFTAYPRVGILIDGFASIYMVTTIVAIKVFVGSFTNLFKYIAGMTRVYVYGMC